MRVILLGATGMVGQGVLREGLLDPEVESVLTLGRNATAQQHEKLHKIVLNDLFDLSSIEGKLSGYDACFFCLGVSSVGMKKEAYRRVTYDLTITVAGPTAALTCWKFTSVRTTAPRVASSGDLRYWWISRDSSWRNASSRRHCPVRSRMRFSP